MLAGFGYRVMNGFYINGPNSSYSDNMAMYEILKVTVYCDFDFQSFPFDDQECDLSLYDPINDASWVIFDEIGYLCYESKQCLNKNVDGERRWMSLPDQHAMPYKISMKRMPTRNWTPTNSSYFQHPSSYSTVRFSMQRKSFGLLIGSFYIPTGLFALLSTGSFIINPEIVSIFSIVLLFLSNLTLYVLGSWKNGTLGDTISDNIQCLCLNKFYHCAS